MGGAGVESDRTREAGSHAPWRRRGAEAYGFRAEALDPATSRYVTGSRPVHARRVKAALHERVGLGRIEATIHLTRHSGVGVEATRHERRIWRRDRSGERHNGDKTE